MIAPLLFSTAGCPAAVSRFNGAGVATTVDVEGTASAAGPAAPQRAAVLPEHALRQSLLLHREGTAAAFGSNHESV